MATAKEVLAALAALAGENEAVLGQNNTTVNKYFNVKGVAYCGYSLLYAAKKAGSGILDGCANAAFVPTLKTFLAGKYQKVSNSAAQAGDIFVYTKPGGTGTHTGFVYAPYNGSGTVITLEGNSTVYATEAEARASSAGSGKFEGIGYKKRVLDGTFAVYRPVYDGAAPVVPKGPTVTVTLDTLRQGDTGAQVKTVQRVLYSRGVKGADGKPITADGSFGANTLYAVKALQRELGVAVDGVVGRDTWVAMLTKLW